MQLCTLRPRCSRWSPLWLNNWAQLDGWPVLKLLAPLANKISQTRDLIEITSRYRCLALRTRQNNQIQLAEVIGSAFKAVIYTEACAMFASPLEFMGPRRRRPACLSLSRASWPSIGSMNMSLLFARCSQPANVEPGPA